MGSINFSQKIFASILFQIFPGANIGEIINFGITKVKKAEIKLN